MLRRLVMAGAKDGTEVPDKTLRRLNDLGVSVWCWYPKEDQVRWFGAGVQPDIPQGRPLDEILGWIGPGDRETLRATLELAVRNGSSGTIRFESVRTGRLCEGTYFPLDDAVPARCLHVIVRDITESVRTEKALRDSIEHYRAALELNPEIPWLADPAGNIIEFGPRWLDLVGMTVEQTLGQGWLEAVHPDDRGAIIPIWEHSLSTGDPLDNEFRIRLRDNTYRWMRSRGFPKRDENGHILRWYGTLEDMHDRKIAETALRESEGFARSILESSTMAIEVLDTEGRLTFMNGPGRRLMEVADFETIRNRQFGSFWPSDVAPVIREAIDLARKGEVVRKTLFGPTERGTPKWWDLSLSPISDADGRVTRLLALSQDVTEPKHNEMEIEESARRLDNALESTMDCVVSVDRAWRVTYMNKRASAFFNSPVSQVGANFHKLFDAAAAEPFFARYRRAMDERCSISFEDYLASIGAWLEVQAYGSDDGLIIFFRDVTERRLAQEQIAHLARHDSLTGLPNRLSFHDELQGRLASLSGGGMLALMSIDLDDFKQVNDTLGHLAGDAMLREVARRLSLNFNSVVGRLGGDEFAVLLAVNEPKEAEDAARNLIRTIAQPYRINGETVEIGASLGIAMAPRDGTGADTLIHHADIALYRVKATGGRNYCFFEPAMDQALRERREIIRELGIALVRNELSVVYQPQMEIGTNRLVGLEALARWKSPTRGEVSPAVFIPLAEESGLIDEIGRFVLQQAARQAVLWPDTISLAVNLSPAQFRTGAVGEAVSRALRSSGLSPRRLELEITESVLLDQASGAIGVLEGLHASGVRVALDDFGTGYSSLSYLQRFKFDKIKIDRSFVSDLPDSGGSAAIVRAIIGLGRSLQTRVTAEGVETFEQLAFLADEGCEEAQGYLFSTPLPAEQALALAQTRAQIPPGRRLGAA